MLNLRNKWTMGFVALGAAAIVGVSGTSVYSTVYAQSEDTETTPVPGIQRQDRLMLSQSEHSAILAEVLGISEEELDAAIATAHNAAIDQAVADGRLTQAQADTMKADDDDFGWGWGMAGRGVADSAYLAEALGITEEELTAAYDEVQTRLIADAVAAGEMTQEQADLLVARQALQEYQQAERQAEYEATLAEAVAEGALTQAQADQLLSEQGPGSFGRGIFGHGSFGRGGFEWGGMGNGIFDMGKGPRGGHHGGHHGGPIDDMMRNGEMRGERAGRGPGGLPEETPAAPEDATPESSSGTTSPSSALEL